MESPFVLDRCIVFVYVMGWNTFKEIESAGQGQALFERHKIFRRFEDLEVKTIIRILESK